MQIKMCERQEAQKIISLFVARPLSKMVPLKLILGLVLLSSCCLYASPVPQLSRLQQRQQTSSPFEDDAEDATNADNLEEVSSNFLAFFI